MFWQPLTIVWCEIQCTITWLFYVSKSSWCILFLVILYLFLYISDHAIREREKWNERLDQVWQERGTYRRFPFNGLTGQTRIFGKIWSMFLKYLAKTDFILISSKFSGQIGPKPKRLCVPFNNLTGLAVLMESAPGIWAKQKQNQALLAVNWSKHRHSLVSVTLCVLETFGDTFSLVVYPPVKVISSMFSANNIHTWKNFSILIGYEQCNFFEIQCQKMKYSAEKRNTVQIS